MGGPGWLIAGDLLFVIGVGRDGGLVEPELPGERGDRPAVAVERVRFHPGVLRLQVVPPVVGSELSSPSLAGGTSRFSPQTKGPRVTPRASARFVLNSLQFSCQAGAVLHDQLAEALAEELELGLRIAGLAGLNELPEVVIVEHDNEAPVVLGGVPTPRDEARLVVEASAQD